MRYLVTDSENKSWRGEVWSEDVSHKETNSNYFFWTYTHPLVASFLIPNECRNLQNPRLWTCECTDLADVDYGTISHDWGFRRRYPYVKSIKEIEMFQPTYEQRICFSMLCTINMTENPTILAWIRNWMHDIDRTPETAQKVSDVLTDQMFEKFKRYREFYTSSAYPLVYSVVKPEEVGFYSSAGAYRAYIDSLVCPECGENTSDQSCTNTECGLSRPEYRNQLFAHLDLEKIAEIVKNVSIPEIASVSC